MKQNLNITTLIIDFGGVLIDLDRARCIRRFLELGLTDIERLLDVYHQQGFFLQFERGEITAEAFREGIRQRIGKPVNDSLIDEAWNSFLVSIPPHKLKLLLELRKQYTVYLLSNTNTIHWDWSLEHAFGYGAFGIDDYFDRRFLSFRMHLAKPDPAIFRQVIDETGLVPEETLFIDDSEANCRAAEAFGIHTYTPTAREDWSHLFNPMRS
jgi:putative hydrolase of the HAD superfamily